MLQTPTNHFFEKAERPDKYVIGAIESELKKFRGTTSDQNIALMATRLHVTPLGTREGSGGQAR